MQATNPWSDFTAGHITPLGQGAPPNSWAYEEFTVPDIEESSTTVFEENGVIKQTLKHLFLPIRSTWSSERSDLMFDNEQAYRFAKRITDAGGSVTFSNTTDTDGTTSEDEVEILTFMDQQFTINADATVYKRPEGAFLVGETLSIDSNNFEKNNLTLFPNPVTKSFKLSKEIASAIIYNLSGQKILEFKSNQTAFDVSILNDGIYVFKSISKNGESQFSKFIKQ
jgi:hypothetical protein